MQLFLPNQPVFYIATMFVFTIAIGAFFDHAKPKIRQAFYVQAFYNVVLLAFLQAFYYNIIVADTFTGLFDGFAFYFVFCSALRNGCYCCRFHTLVFLVMTFIAEYYLAIKFRSLHCS